MQITSAQWFGVVRVFLTIIGTLLVSRGWASQSQVDQLVDAINQALPVFAGAVGVLLPIISLVWSMIAQSRKAHLNAVKEMHAVDKILIKPTSAANDPTNPAVTMAKDTTEPKVVFAPVAPPPNPH